MAEGVVRQGVARGRRAEALIAETRAGRRSTAGPSGDQRFAGVDGLRGIAAVAVVLVHVWMYTGALQPGRSAALDGVIGELRVGLVFFFVLSGYLLCGPWVRAALDDRARPDLSRYALHRVARVLPAYWVALLGAFVLLTGTGHPREVDASALPVFAVFIQNQIGATAGMLNPPTWSLAVEVGFYLMLPAMGWVFTRPVANPRVRVLATCGLVMTAGLLWSTVGELEQWPRTAMTSPLTYLPAFACGVAARALRHGVRLGRCGAAVLLLSGWTLVVANGVWHADGTGVLGHVLRDLPAAAGFAAIIAGATARPRPLLDSRPLRALGTVSYGVYLWHMPVLYWLRTRGGFPMDPIAAFAIVLVPSLALGAISWAAIERPVLAWARRRGPRAQVPRSPTSAGSAGHAVPRLARHLQAASGPPSGDRTAAQKA